MHNRMIWEILGIWVLGGKPGYFGPKIETKCHKSRSIACHGSLVGFRYVQVSAGGNHTLLLRSDGKAFMIGDIWPFRVSQLSEEFWRHRALPCLQVAVEGRPECWSKPGKISLCSWFLLGLSRTRGRWKDRSGRNRRVVWCHFDSEFVWNASQVMILLLRGTFGFWGISSLKAEQVAFCILSQKVAVTKTDASPWEVCFTQWCWQAMATHMRSLVFVGIYILATSFMMWTSRILVSGGSPDISTEESRQWGAWADCPTIREQPEAAQGIEWRNQTWTKTRRHQFIQTEMLAGTRRSLPGTSTSFGWEMMDR